MKRTLIALSALALIAVSANFAGEAFAHGAPAGGNRGGGGGHISGGGGPRGGFAPRGNVGVPRGNVGVPRGNFNIPRNFGGPRNGVAPRYGRMPQAVPPGYGRLPPGYGRVPPGYGRVPPTGYGRVPMAVPPAGYDRNRGYEPGRGEQPGAGFDHRGQPPVNVNGGSRPDGHQHMSAPPAPAAGVRDGARHDNNGYRYYNRGTGRNFYGSHYRGGVFYPGRYAYPYPYLFPQYYDCYNDDPYLMNSCYPYPNPDNGLWSIQLWFDGQEIVAYWDPYEGGYWYDDEDLGGYYQVQEPGAPLSLDTGN